MSSEPVKLALRIYREAELHDSIRPQDLSSWRSHWIPEFARLAGIGHRQEDEGWLWDRFVKVADSSARSFGVSLDGKTQGMMLLKINATSRLAPVGGRGKALGMVYIDFLASAPWNRLEDGSLDRKVYKLVGAVMMRKAVEISISAGYGGRVGLFSLQGAQTWYRGLGMIEMDNSSGLSYFEFTPEAAQKFFTYG